MPAGRTLACLRANGRPGALQLACLASVVASCRPDACVLLRQCMPPAPVAGLRYRASGGTNSGPSAHVNSPQGSECPDGLLGGS
eukprot:2924116-Alexandrium_andersonii.AAC.1